MDDLQMLSEVFTEQPPPSGDVIAAARAQLPLSKPARRRVVRIGLPVSAVAATAAVITGLAVTGSAIPAPAAGPGIYHLPALAQHGAGAGPSARQILLTAAQTVGRAAVPATGRYWMARTEVGNFRRVGPAKDHYVLLEKVGAQSWAARSGKARSPDLVQALGVQFASAADQAAWRRDGSPTSWAVTQDTGVADPHGDADGFDRGLTAARGKAAEFSVTLSGPQFQFSGLGRQGSTAAQLRALPADPARLKALLLAGFSPVHQNVSAEAYLFEITPTLLTLPVTRAVRSALYRMLAGLPGVQSLGQVRDAGGRQGVAVGFDHSYSGCGDESVLNPNGSVNTNVWTFASCVVQQRLVINPQTGLPLAQELRYVKLPAGQEWSAPGGLFSYQLFLAAHFTNSSPPIPSN